MGGFEVEEKGITVIKLGVDNGGSDSGCSFKVKHGSNAAEVTNMHEAGAREVGDVIREGEMWIKGNAKIAHRRVGGESER